MFSQKENVVYPLVLLTFALFGFLLNNLEQNYESGARLFGVGQLSIETP